MLKEKLSLLPTTPGCYLMKNKDGVIIYVGKAKNLKRRVSSYFIGKKTGKTAMLVSEITDFEYILVNSNTESLVLEINLIKKYDPKYNILLRDDKSYPYIELTNEDVPRLLVVRNINKKKNNKSRMFGPYPNVTAARGVVNLLNRLYPFRKCKNYNTKPCLYYHIGECLGYCTHNVDKLKVKEMEDSVIKFLNGNSDIVTSKIKKEMEEASSKLNFEKAKELKEMLDYINVTLVKQKVEISDYIDRDVFGYSIYKGYVSIEVLFIRGGKIVEHHNYIAPIMDDDFINTYIINFYNSGVLKPKEVLVPEIADYNTLESILNISVKSPVKGVKKDLVDMANSNASNALKEKFELIKRDENKTVGANEELKNILKLEKLDRIELFDNSNLFGTFSVSGMVVFKNGLPSKKDYRKFKIVENTNDDYKMMEEVIYRRYFRVLKDNLERPNLIIVDGGLGQINVARKVISDLNMNIPVVGLKKDNHHTTESLLAFAPVKEVKIDKNSNLFYYLERMQDEIHNFTINYHKQIRSKGALESILDNIEGIGEKRKIMLLKKYKTLNKIKNASTNELEEILPKNVAITLKDFLISEKL